MEARDGLEACLLPFQLHLLSLALGPHVAQCKAVCGARHHSNGCAAVICCNPPPGSAAARRKLAS
jgi:hypothetical protein